MSRQQHKEEVQTSPLVSTAKPKAQKRRIPKIINTAAEIATISERKPELLEPEAQVFKKSELHAIEHAANNAAAMEPETMYGRGVEAINGVAHAAGEAIEGLPVEMIDHAIEEILGFETDVSLEELVAGAEVSELSALLPAYPEPEQLEQEGTQDGNIFVELEEYIETLKITEPEKAEAVRPMADEVIQIAELLVELQGIRAVDLGIKTDAEIAEADAEIAQIEARLEVVCRQLLEALEIEPTAENVQALMQELIIAAQNQAYRKLSIEELANNYMHEAKLPRWFQKFQQFLHDPLTAIRAMGQLAIAET